MVVQSLPPGQFAMTNTVLFWTNWSSYREVMLLAMDLVVFRWMSTVGDLSVMHDEIDPALASEKLRKRSHTSRFWVEKGALGG